MRVFSYCQVCCSVLRFVAVCCSVLQCVAVCCTVLYCVPVCCSVLQCVAVCCRVYIVDGLCESFSYMHMSCHTFTLCSWHTALQHTSTQLTATHCNTLQQPHQAHVLLISAVKTWVSQRCIYEWVMSHIFFFSFFSTFFLCGSHGYPTGAHINDSYHTFVYFPPFISCFLLSPSFFGSRHMGLPQILIWMRQWHIPPPFFLSSFLSFFHPFFLSFFLSLAVYTWREINLGTNTLAQMHIWITHSLSFFFLGSLHMAGNLSGHGYSSADVAAWKKRRRGKKMQLWLMNPKTT